MNTLCCDFVFPTKKNPNSRKKRVYFSKVFSSDQMTWGITSSNRIHKQVSVQTFTSKIDTNNSSWPLGLINSETQQATSDRLLRKLVLRDQQETERNRPQSRRCCDAKSKDVLEASLLPLNTDLFRSDSHWRCFNVEYFQHFNTFKHFVLAVTLFIDVI